MTDIIHGRPRPLPVENPFFRWWQSIDQWTLLATLGLIVVGLLLSMAASVPLADSNDMPAFYYVHRQAIYGMISFSLIIIVTLRAPFLKVSSATSTAEFPAPTIAISIL